MLQFRTCIMQWTRSKVAWVVFVTSDVSVLPSKLVLFEVAVFLSDSVEYLKHLDLNSDWNLPNLGDV